ncbi:MAG TPA: phosphate propanoyltransferase [Anaerovoracaceae bacterium]|nr:phosphate propanoyltransferase [Anaerovoracaceae bacterium]
MEPIEKLDEAAIKAIVDEVIRRLKAKEEGIVVGVSNRHLHLSKEDFAALFGPNRELTKIKDLAQPGEFAAAETVNLIGPKGVIKNVRVLGPCRTNTQVEISRTDSYLLGIRAPVRESGKIEGTPGVVIEGPNGKISTERGLIVALRHIHLDTESAQRYGVKNGDTVSVKAGGERGAVFDNVLARVSDQYVREMHLDTDEANAADVKSGDYVQIVSKTEKKSGIKVLALFTGGTGGFEEAAGQVGKLKEAGWEIGALFTAGAEKLFSKEYLQKKFEGFDLCFESQYGNQNLLKDVRLMLIPVLTVNTLTKVALGIADTPAAHLIAGALMNGIPVVAAKDACDARSFRKSVSGAGNQSEAFARKIDGYVKTAEEFGITLVSSRDLFETATVIGNPPNSAKAKASAAVSPRKSTAGSTESPKNRIITREDVVRAKQDGSMKIIISGSTKVTPFAKDAAGELGVEILCISQT